MDNIVQPAIDLVKSGNIDAAHDMLFKVIDHLIPWNVDAIVLGCTEIPLAVRETQHKSIPLINSIDSLVKAVIKEYTK
jgi:aspartate racemase